MTRSAVEKTGSGPVHGELSRRLAEKRRAASYALHVLTYLATAEATDTTAAFLSTWGASLAPQITVRTYEEIARVDVLPAGAYVFSDLERLSDDGLRLAGRLWSRLAEASPERPPLNDPSLHRRRGDLLRVLTDAGINRFHVHRAGDSPESWRYPVFLRYEREHWGPMTAPQATPAAVRRTLRRARLIGHRVSDLLAIEFCDTVGEDGLYRKYGAYVVGDQIIPRQLFFSHGWVIRLPDEVSADAIREEREYLEANPHREVLAEVARLARVEYGRIDYGLFDGRVQVWEINTNPLLIRPIQGYRPEERPNQQFFAAAIVAALASLASTPVGGEVSVGDLWEGRPWPSRVPGVGTRRGRAASAAARKWPWIRRGVPGRRQVDIVTTRST